jgi:hypothetical protein
VLACVLCAALAIPRPALISLVLGEHYRVVSNQVEVVVHHADGSVKRGISNNLRTNGGTDWWNGQLFGAANGTAVYLALTTDTATPAAGDTSCASEETANGLARVQAAVNHTAGTASSTLTYQWTYAGSTSKTIDKVCLFNQASGGTLIAEAFLNPSASVAASGDKITVNYTLNW